MATFIAITAFECGGTCKGQNIEKVFKFTAALDALAGITCLVVGILGAYSVIGMPYLVAGALIGCSAMNILGPIKLVIMKIKQACQKDEKIPYHPYTETSADECLSDQQIDD